MNSTNAAVHACGERAKAIRIKTAALAVVVLGTAAASAHAQNKPMSLRCVRALQNATKPVASQRSSASSLGVPSP